MACRGSAAYKGYSDQEGDETPLFVELLLGRNTDDQAHR